MCFCFLLLAFRFFKRFFGVCFTFLSVFLRFRFSNVFLTFEACFCAQKNGRPETDSKRWRSKTSKADNPKKRFLNVFLAFFDRFWTFGVQQLERKRKPNANCDHLAFGFSCFFGRVCKFVGTFFHHFRFFRKLLLIHVFDVCFEPGRKPPNVNWTLRAFVATTKPRRGAAR